MFPPIELNQAESSFLTLRVVLLSGIVAYFVQTFIRKQLDRHVSKKLSSCPIRALLRGVVRCQIWQAKRLFAANGHSSLWLASRIGRRAKGF